MSWKSSRLGSSSSRRLHPDRIERPVALSPRTPHGRTLRPVQHPELDPGRVGRATHHAPQRVDLPRHDPLGHAADRRVAAHLPDPSQVGRHEQRAHAHPRGRRGRLRPPRDRRPPRSRRTSYAYAPHLTRARHGKMRNPPHGISALRSTGSSRSTRAAGGPSASAASRASSSASLPAACTSTEPSGKFSTVPASPRRCGRVACPPTEPDALHAPHDPVGPISRLLFVHRHHLPTQNSANTTSSTSSTEITPRISSRALSAGRRWVDATSAGRPSASALRNDASSARAFSSPSRCLRRVTTGRLGAPRHHRAVHELGQQHANLIQSLAGLRRHPQLARHLAHPPRGALSTVAGRQDRPSSPPARRAPPAPPPGRPPPRPTAPARRSRTAAPDRPGPGIAASPRSRCARCAPPPRGARPCPPVGTGKPPSCTVATNASRVVPGSSVTIARSSPSERVVERRLADVRAGPRAP